MSENTVEILEHFTTNRHFVIVYTDLEMERNNHYTEDIIYNDLFNTNYNLVVDSFQKNHIAFYRSVITTFDEKSGNNYYQGMYFPILGITYIFTFIETYQKINNFENPIFKKLITNFPKINNNLDDYSFIPKFFLSYNHLRISAALGGGEWEKDTYHDIREYLLNYDIDGIENQLTLINNKNIPIIKPIIKPILSLEQYKIYISINKKMNEHQCCRVIELNDFNNYFETQIENINNECNNYLETLQTKTLETKIKVTMKEYNTIENIYF